VTGSSLRAKRVAAAISGQAICQLAGISRPKLSDIERENITASPAELQRLDGAIDQILWTRQRLGELAAEAGLTLTGLRL